MTTGYSSKSGEIIRCDPGAHQCDSYNEPCSACEGTGRDCVEVEPITIQDLEEGPRR